MAGDPRPRYFPYREESCVNYAHDVREPSPRNTELAWNMHRRQVYRAYAPKPSSWQSERIYNDYRKTVCLSHVHRPNDQTLKADYQCYFDRDLAGDPAASRGFPILADRYRLHHRPSENVARHERESSHPHVLRIDKLKNRPASLAMPKTITDPEFTGSTRLRQS